MLALKCLYFNDSYPFSNLCSIICQVVAVFWIICKIKPTLENQPFILLVEIIHFIRSLREMWENKMTYLDFFLKIKQNK